MGEGSAGPEPYHREAGMETLVTLETEAQTGGHVGSKKLVVVLGVFHLCI